MCSSEQRVVCMCGVQHAGVSAREGRFGHKVLIYASAKAGSDKIWACRAAPLSPRVDLRVAWAWACAPATELTCRAVRCVSAMMPMAAAAGGGARAGAVTGSAVRRRSVRASRPPAFELQHACVLL